MSSRLSDAQKAVIALRHLEGESISSLAESYEYTYAGMANVLRSDDMRERMSELRTKAETAAVHARVKILFKLPELVDKSMAVALSDQKDACRQREYLMDKVMPTVQKQDNVNTHRLEMSPELEKLIHNLNDRRDDSDVSRSMEARILEGEAAIPQAIPANVGANGGSGAANQ